MVTMVNKKANFRRNNIKKLLEKRGKNIQDLCNSTTLTYPATHALVHREDLGNTPVGTIIDIANFLGVNVEDLWREDTYEDVEERKLFVIGEYTNIRVSKEDHGTDRIVNKETLWVGNMREVLEDGKVCKYIKEKTGKELDEVEFEQKVDLIEEYYEGTDYFVKYWSDEDKAWEQMKHIIEDMESVEDVCVPIKCVEDVDGRIYREAIYDGKYFDEQFEKLRESLIGERTLEEIDEIVYKTIGSNYNLSGSIKESGALRGEVNGTYYMEGVSRDCNGKPTVYEIGIRMEERDDKIIVVDVCS